MSKILIIGNVLKDVYLKLDGAKDEFEQDASGINWLELGFNGDSHNFFHRTSVYGGAAVTLAVLNKLGVEASILGSKAEVHDGEISWSGDPADYRYILCYKDNITYFTPGKRKPTELKIPTQATGRPEWILVDRSAVVTQQLVSEIKNYHKFSPSTKIAVHAEKHPTPAGQVLAEMADLLFIEDEPPIHHEEKIVDIIEVDKPNTQLKCHISPRKLSFAEAEEFWSLDKTDMMTHLTVYSTIVATILGIIAADGTPEDALLWAKINAERATLDGPLSADKLQEYTSAELEKRDSVQLLAKSLMVGNKGVLAIDESERKLSKRLLKYNIKSSHRTEKEFYSLLVTTPEIKNYLSGVILSNEVGRWQVNERQNLTEFLVSRGLVPGLKVNEKAEVYEILRQGYKDGYRFAKRHAIFESEDFLTSMEQAMDLADFAKKCQQLGLVPMVEAEVAQADDITKSAEMTARVMNLVFEKMAERHVDLTSLILKTNMITGKLDDAGQVLADKNEIGMATAAILRHSVPKFVAGLVFMSGGQASKVATANLAAICQNSPFPWPISFAFSRALEEPVLATWKGDPAQIKAAQAALVRHLQANVDALHYAKIERLASGQNDGNISVLSLG